MKKSCIIILFSIIMIFTAFTGCENEVVESAPDPLELFYSAIESDYPAEVMEFLTSFGTNPDLGFRTPGSTAGFAAAEYLYTEMQEIGLSNVIMDAITADSWEFIKASLAYTDDDGGVYEMTLASYAAHFECEDEEIALIYAGRGTEEDYEGLDAEGKLVLIDIDQADDWHISWPAYQAKLFGARALVAVSVGGYAQYDDETLGIINNNVPLDAPAFTITVKDADMLKRFIEYSEEGEIIVSLTAESIVETDSTAYAVIGEIPGDEGTEEVICMIAHYDGYFQGFEDNAAGVGTALGIAKALVDSGYAPDKTIKFILHPAYEWGLYNPWFGWGAENAFALINIDGGVTCNQADGIEIHAAWEIADFVNSIGFDVEGGSFARFETIPLTEGFPYALNGIPVLRSGFSGIDELIEEVYHTNRDTLHYLYNEETVLFAQKLYGTYVIELDRLPVKPLDYIAFFEDLADSVDLKASTNAEALIDAVYDAAGAAKDLRAKIDYGDWSNESAREFNSGLFKISKSIYDKLISLTWENEILFYHERYQRNVSMIRQAIDRLESGDGLSAVSEFLSKVDLNKCACYFDKETYSYFAERAPGGSTDLYDIISSILIKIEEYQAHSYLEEAQALEIELISQQKLLRDAISRMTKDVISITKALDQL